MKNEGHKKQVSARVSCTDRAKAAPLSLSLFVVAAVVLPEAMSGALGRACGAAARRLAAAQRGGAAAGVARGAASWPAHDAPPPPRGGSGAGGAAGGASGDGAASEEWLKLARAGLPVNPCNSPFHPAAKVAPLAPPPAAPRLSVQAAYDPRGMCFACGACPYRARAHAVLGAAPPPPRCTVSDARCKP
jgi:hypothetical protein